jgi:hypothetical protein
LKLWLVILIPIVTDIAGNQSWIKHRENGQLVTINDYKMLAEEIIWANDNNIYREKQLLLIDYLLKTMPITKQT